MSDTKPDLEQARSEWDQVADSWDTQESARSYSNRAFATLEPLMKEELGENHLRILDFGAGTGLLSEKLLAHAEDLVALDLSPKMIEVLNAKAKRLGWSPLTTLCGDLASPEVTEHSAMTAPFDLIVASSVCSFVPDFEDTLGRLFSHLRPGGLFVQWDWLTPSDQDGGFSIDELRSAYERAGFDTVQVGQGFAFEFEDKALPVLLGCARRPN